VHGDGAGDEERNGGDSGPKFHDAPPEPTWCLQAQTRCHRFHLVRLGSIEPVAVELNRSRRTACTFKTLLMPDKAVHVVAVDKEQDRWRTSTTSSMCRRCR